MTLYVVPIPDPAPGADWRTLVPGHYFYDVTGITAQLATGGTSLTVAEDASGNGNDGTYSGLGAGTPFVAGLVPGDDAINLTHAPAVNKATNVLVPPTLVDWSTNFTFACLWRNPSGAPDTFFAFGGSGGIGPLSILEFWWGDGPANAVILWDQVTNQWATALGAVPFDGLAHLLTVTRSGTTVAIYVDGVSVPLTITGGSPDTTPLDVAGVNGPFAGGGNGRGICDEWACWRRALTAGEVASLQAARGSFAAYSTATLALAPDCYYHMDGLVAGTGRQPSLIITDGTTELEAIPTGFAAVGTPGPYQYSWQPRLNADTQSTDGTLTTVAIPPLLLPAGYTIGTRTLDLQSADQWSNVVLWWDDAYQQQVVDFRPYEYPPGATLVYRQLGT